MFSRQRTGEMAGDRCNVIQSGHLLVKTTLVHVWKEWEASFGCGQATVSRRRFLGRRFDLEHTYAGRYVERFADIDLVDSFSAKSNKFINLLSDKYSLSDQLKSK